MLVTFDSSETGEIMMFADVARTLLRAIGKETTARGTFTRDEMAGAAERLRQAAKGAEAPPPDSDDASDNREPVVVMSQRAWPLIDMLERTARGGPKANIVWKAAADF